jgi:hypothetical protein
MSLREEFMDIARSNIADYSRDEAENWIDNEAEPSNGSVGGLIYYSETEELARHYNDDMNDIINDSGIYIEKQLSANDKCWVAWSLLLPDLKEELLSEINIEIEVNENLITALLEMEGIETEISSFIEDKEEYIEVDVDLVAEIDSVKSEVAAYCFYVLEIDKDELSDITDGLDLIDDAALSGEQYVHLVKE